MLEEDLDYRLSRFLLANACADHVLDADECNSILSEAYVNEEPLLPLCRQPIMVGDIAMNPHSGKSRCNLDGSGQGSAGFKRSRKYCLTSKMYCTSCGSHYGPVSIHTTSYNNLVWACKGRFDKQIHCHEKYIYDRVLNYLLHKAAREYAYRRKIPEKIEAALENKSSVLEEYFGELGKREVLQMIFDLEDILFMVSEIAMESEQNMNIMWINGKHKRYRIPG